MRLRLTLDFLGILSVLFLPAWVAIVIMAILSARYRAYEVLFLGLIMDFMWAPAAFSYATLPWFTLTAILFVWILEPLRSEFMPS